ncbi:MAG: hypothetical protein WBF17_18180 [Phycisphaerae bacterium]
MIRRDTAAILTISCLFGLVAVIKVGSLIDVICGTAVIVLFIWLVWRDAEP